MPTFRTLANMPPVWTSSPAGSPVSPSALPESNLEPPTPVGYGPNSGDSFASYDPKQRCWRTLQGCFDTDLGESLVTWPRAGMTRNGTAYQRPPLAPLTAATAYSSSLHRGPNSEGIWPTATTQDHSTRFAQGGMPLGMAARLWPTPTTSDATGGPGGKRGGGNNLRTEVAEVQSGQLNPQWVEWLMGFPAGWTDLED
jgi:hypothetical protein